MWKYFAITCPYDWRCLGFFCYLFARYSFMGISNAEEVKSKNPSVAIVTELGAAQSPPAGNISESQRASVRSIKKKPRKTNAQRKNRRAVRQARHVGGTATTNQGGLQLAGSFTMTCGDWVIVQGNGSIQMSLSKQAKESLSLAATESIEQTAGKANDYLEVLQQIPETIRITRDMLETLADPKVQENLRQVQQLLRMYQSVSQGVPTAN